MQTLTLLFGLAIVAIAIENFTANFLHVKSSDAGAQGDQDMQSRTGKGHLYWLRGATGTETVIIRDGAKPPLKQTLKVGDQEFFATNPKITIEYTNDQCCEPDDKNVLFTTRAYHRISTYENKNNYFKNWNCSFCSTSISSRMKKQMDLQSRSNKVDRCYETRKASVEDCDKCTLVKEGQFCYPGNYTVEFKIDNQCEDVTFGGCDFDKIIHKTIPGIAKARKCNKICSEINECVFYRHNKQTQKCILLKENYRKVKCNIVAGPMDKSKTACIIQDNSKTCDSILDEDCEYDGELLEDVGPGQIDDADSCQNYCKLRAPACKYWVWNNKERDCILKKSAKKTCSFRSGPEMEEAAYDTCGQEYNKEDK